MSYYLHASHKNKTYAAVHNMTGCPPGNCRKKGEGSAVGAKKETTERYNTESLYKMQQLPGNCFKNGNSSVFAGHRAPDDSFLYYERERECFLRSAER